MRNLLDKIKFFWGKFIEIIATDAFIFTYPFALLAVIAFCTKSMLVVVALVLWVIAISVKLNDNGESAL